MLLLVVTKPQVVFNRVSLFKWVRSLYVKATLLASITY